MCVRPSWSSFRTVLYCQARMSTSNVGVLHPTLRERMKHLGKRCPGTIDQALYYTAFHLEVCCGDLMSSPISLRPRPSGFSSVKAFCATAVIDIDAVPKGILRRRSKSRSRRRGERLRKISYFLHLTEVMSKNLEFPISSL